MELTSIPFPPSPSLSEAPNSDTFITTSERGNEHYSDSPEMDWRREKERGRASNGGSVMMGWGMETGASLDWLVGSAPPSE